MFRNYSIQHYIIKQCTVWILFKRELWRGGESYGYTTPIKEGFETYNLARQACLKKLIELCQGQKEDTEQKI